LYQLWTIYADDCGTITGINEWQGKSKYSEKTCSSVDLTTINRSEITGRRGETPVTDRLNNGTVFPKVSDMGEGLE
jgi:hypothetical protein